MNEHNVAFALSIYLLYECRRIGKLATFNFTHKMEKTNEIMMMKSVYMSPHSVVNEKKEDKGKPINILILAFAMQDQQ